MEKSQEATDIAAKKRYERQRIIQYENCRVAIDDLCQSPIEVMFARALCVVLAAENKHPFRVKRDIDPPATAADVPPGFTIVPQAGVLQFWVDFFIIFHSPGAFLGALIVECDGHDYHERTKEQAAKDRSRDRAIKLANWDLIRFTGSEIHRGQIRCAEETLQHLDMAAKRRPLRG